MDADSEVSGTFFQKAQTFCCIIKMFNNNYLFFYKISVRLVFHQVLITINLLMIRGARLIYRKMS